MNRDKIFGFLSEPDSIYYTPAEKDCDRENEIKNRLDYWHTKMPYLGVRKLRNRLQIEDHIAVGRKLIKRCMDEMGIYAVYPKPNLSKRNLQHKIYLYLLHCRLGTVRHSRHSTGYSCG